MKRIADFDGSSAEAEQNVCRICRAPGLGGRRIVAQDYASRETFIVRECLRCGVMATTPRPMDPDRFYFVNYRRYRGLTRSVLRKLLQKRVAGWCGSVQKKGAVLEVGCGEGWMLSAFEKAGWNPIGTERDLLIAREAVRESTAPVFVGEIEAVRPAASFDIIVLFQVLEHLPDPVRVLREAACRLTPDGRVIVSVPNTNSWQARLFRGKWFHYDVPRHLHHFSSKSLSETARISGLDVVRFNYFSPEHDPFGWIQSLLNVLTGTPNRLTLGLMGAVPKNRAVFVVEAAFAILLAPFAILLAQLSGFFRAGAIMQAELSLSKS